MAAVWRVEDDDGSAWALKVLTLARPEVRERFLAEASVQLRVAHPNVVSARELLEVDGEPALVLALVDGPSLDKFLQDDPPFDVRDALAGQILEGVAYAHSLGLVHRDLKPANVLVASVDGHLVARITDFGLVKQEGLSATRSGIALGTPRYMAPEQIRDAKRVDTRADVWSLGALLYELYTDRSPFHRDSLFETFTAVVDGAYTDPSEFGAPPRVRDAIAACLRVDPADRAPSVAALAHLLRGEAGAPPVGARAKPLPTAPTLVAPSGPEMDEPVDLPPPPPPVRRAARSPPPSLWLGAWGLALLMVLGVFGGGAAVLTVYVVSGALESDDDPPSEPVEPAKPPPRRRRR